MSAVEIALLIADGGNDVIRLVTGFDLGPLAALERHDRSSLVVVGPGHQAGPAVKSLAMEIEDRDLALGVVASGNEEDRDVPGVHRIEKFARWLDCPGFRPVDPGRETAGIFRQH